MTTLPVKYSLQLLSMDPSEAAENSWVIDAADWIELKAYFSPANISYFADLSNQQDLEWDQELDDFGDRDTALEDTVNKVIEEIDLRRSSLGDAYPFELTEQGYALKLKSYHCNGCFSYLFSLVISHFTDSPILPSPLRPSREEIFRARNLFQICSTVAAAGYCEGPAFSMGWPRTDNTGFLEKLKQIWTHYGDGIPVEALPDGTSSSIKDGGVDVISWWPEPDRRRGRGYLIGQVATGLNWKDKSAQTARSHFKHWFKEQPRTREHIATFIPFVIDEKEFNWRITEHEQILNRTRLPAHVNRATQLIEKSIGPVECYEELVKIRNWLNRYKASIAGIYAA